MKTASAIILFAFAAVVSCESPPERPEPIVPRPKPEPIVPRPKPEVLPPKPEVLPTKPPKPEVLPVDPKPEVLPVDPAILLPVDPTVIIDPLPPAMTCKMAPDAGDCKGRFKKFFFDTKKDKCRSFYYGGCGGNPNRFDSRKECKKFCIEK